MANALGAAVPSPKPINYDDLDFVRDFMESFGEVVGQHSSVIMVDSAEIRLTRPGGKHDLGSVVFQSGVPDLLFIPATN